MACMIVRTSQAPLQLGCMSLSLEKRRSMALLGKRCVSSAFLRSNTKESKRESKGSHVSCASAEEGVEPAPHHSQRVDSTFGSPLAARAAKRLAADWCVGRRCPSPALVPVFFLCDPKSDPRRRSNRPRSGHRFTCIWPLPSGCQLGAASDSSRRLRHAPTTACFLPEWFCYRCLLTSCCAVLALRAARF